MIAQIISTFFFVGKIKYAPGTFGSIVASVLAYCFINIFFINKNSMIYTLYVSHFIYIITFILFVVGWIASEIYSKHILAKDPSEIVIDEVVGYFISIIVCIKILNISPFDRIKLLCIINLILFRIFDIFKPWIIGVVDKKVNGGLGIMLDDVLAGIFSGLSSGFIIFLLYAFKVI